MTGPGVNGGSPAGTDPRRLSSHAVGLPGRYAGPLRRQDPAVVGRLAGDRLWLDLRAVPPEQDSVLLATARAVAAEAG